MSIASNITELDNLRKGLATKLTNKGVTASQTEGFETLVPKVDNIPAPVYNASREWSAAHPTYDNAEDILANYTAGICYIFLGNVKITIPSNGTHYYTKDGEVTAGTEVQLTCAEGKDTCWLMEEYESGATATASFGVSFVSTQKVGVGIKNVTTTFESEYFYCKLSVQPYVHAWKCLWCVGGATADCGSLSVSEMIYTDSTSILKTSSITSPAISTLDVNINQTGSLGLTGYFTRVTINKLTYLYTGISNTTFRSGILEFPDLISLRASSTLSFAIQNVVRFRVGAINRNFSVSQKWYNILDFEIGDGFNYNASLSGWTAEYAITHNGEIDRNASLLLISNTRRHILDKVADHTGEGLVRTITCGWVGTLSESEDEEIATALEDLMTDFAEKGWTLQG